MVQSGSVQELRPAAAPGPAPIERPPLHVRGVGEMLDLSLDLLRERFGAYLALSLLLWVPAQAANHALTQAGELTPALLGLALVWFVQNLAIALVTTVVWGELRGERVAAGRAFVTAAARAPALLVNSAINTLAVFAGAMCLLLPGIYLSYLWSCAPAALVLERLGPLRALARSGRLVTGGFWRWGNLLTARIFLTLPFSLIGMALGGSQVRAWVMQQAGLSSAAYDAAQILAVSLFLAIATALASVLFTVFYLDNRVRREGLDLALRLERIAERAAP